MRLQELVDLVKDRKPLPRFPLAISVRAKAVVNKKKLESANLVAVLPGSDPKLKNEYVVLSAHLDHLGIGEPINGDRIYNGAMDNASGSAVLLDLIASLKKSAEEAEAVPAVCVCHGRRERPAGFALFHRRIPR